MASRERAQSDLPSLEDIDRLVHEPARLLIMVHLYVVERADFTFLMNQTGLTWGNLSSHIAKLEEAGYVAIEKTFVGKKPQSIASLTAEGRQAFNIYREEMQSLLG
jgi:DNA-binding MarR family transcriptional regulator